jgi:DNA-binding MarR family transcriptional regulator
LQAPEELDLRTWLLLVRISTHLERRLEETLQKNGLSLPQFDILMTLSRDEGLLQQELARRLLVTKGNICGMIDRMQACSWVERRQDPRDRRANRLYLTDAGRNVLTAAFPAHVATVRDFMAALDTSDLQLLHPILERLEEKLDGDAS